MAASPRTEISGKGWTKKTSIDARKFDVVSQAVLASLTAEPVAFARLVELVTGRLPDFEGSIAWYTITTARELETRGQLVRQQRPVRYFKPARTSKKSASALRPSAPEDKAKSAA